MLTIGDITRAEHIARCRTPPYCRTEAPGGINMATSSDKITDEFLEREIARAALCNCVTVDGDEWRAILLLALRAKLAEPKPTKRPRLLIVPKGEA